MDRVEASCPMMIFVKKTPRQLKTGPHEPAVILSRASRGDRNRRAIVLGRDGDPA